MKPPTPLTRVLQLSVASFFGLAYLSASVRLWADAVNAASRGLHEAYLVTLPIFVIVTVVFGLLMLGTAKRSAWAFWLLVLWLAAGTVSEAVLVSQHGLMNVINQLSWLLLFGPILLAACLYSGIRYGAWGELRRPRIASDPLAAPPDKHRRYY